MFIFALTIASAEACDEPTSSSDLSRQVEAAEQSYGDLDIDGFISATDTLAAALPCLSESVTRSTAANVHRVVGLRAFVDKDGENAKLAFAAARAIQPDYRFPDTLIPPGNPILTDYEAIPLSIESRTSPPELASEGAWRFDGQDNVERPTTWPSIAQTIDARGAVRGSVYLWPGDTLETFDTTVEGISAEPVAVPEPLPPPPSEAGGPNKGLLIGAAGMAVVTGVTYALANGAAKEYRDLETPYEDLDGLRKQANGMTIGWATSATLTAGLGASAFLVARW